MISFIHDRTTSVKAFICLVFENDLCITDDKKQALSLKTAILLRNTVVSVRFFPNFGGKKYNRRVIPFL
jgi:hypothetical protein